MDHKAYLQAEKSLTDVQDDLKQVSGEITDPYILDVEEVLLYIRNVLEVTEKRIMKSMERNESKGVQIVRAGVESPKHEDGYKRKGYRHDSVWAPSISSMEIHLKTPSPIVRPMPPPSGNENGETFEGLPSPTSMPPTPFSSQNLSAVSLKNAASTVSGSIASLSGDISEQSSSPQKICSARM